MESDKAKNIAQITENNAILSKPGADFIFAINEGIEKTSNRREGENPGLSFTSSLKN